MNWSLSLLTINFFAQRILQTCLNGLRLHQWVKFWQAERGEQQSDYALLVALVVVAALAILFVVGPQVAMVYAQTAQSGAATP